MLSSAKSRVLLAATAVALATAPAVAGTDGAILNVRVTVQDACTIEGGTLDFGTYSVGQQAEKAASGAIRYSNCAAGTFKIALDGGNSGSVANRQMTNGEATLNYQIYRGSNHSQVWGATASDAQGVTVLVPGSGDVTIFGLIPGGQNVPAGTYTDTVTATLIF